MLAPSRFFYSEELCEIVSLGDMAEEARYDFKYRSI